MILNLHKLAEARRGVTLGLMSTIFVSLSTGVGTAIIVDGNIPNAMRTSEFGLMLMHATDGSDGGDSSLEYVTSGTDFRRQFGTSPEQETDPRHLESLC